MGFFKGNLVLRQLAVDGFLCEKSPVKCPHSSTIHITLSVGQVALNNLSLATKYWALCGPTVVPRYLFLVVS